MSNYLLPRSHDDRPAMSSVSRRRGSQSRLVILVVGTGVEPVIFAMKWRRLNQLGQPTKNPRPVQRKDPLSKNSAGPGMYFYTQYLSSTAISIRTATDRLSSRAISVSLSITDCRSLAPTGLRGSLSFGLPGPFRFAMYKGIIFVFIKARKIF